LTKREDPPVFPYDLIWEADGDEPLKLEALAANEADYRVRFDVLRRLHAGETPYVDLDILHALVQRLGLADEQCSRLSRDLFLVSGWYLEPAHQKQLRSDRARVRKALSKLASLAGQLSEQLSRLPPIPAAALDYVRSMEPGIIDPDHRFDLPALDDSLHDLSLCAKRMSADLGRDGGRPNKRVRDVALKLAVDAIEDASGQRVAVSRAGTVKSQPYFAGQAGEVLGAFFRLLEPGVNAVRLARRLEEIRLGERGS